MTRTCPPTKNKKIKNKIDTYAYLRRGLRWPARALQAERHAFSKVLSLVPLHTSLLSVSIPLYIPLFFILHTSKLKGTHSQKSSVLCLYMPLDYLFPYLFTCLFFFFYISNLKGTHSQTSSLLCAFTESLPRAQTFENVWYGVPKD